MIFGPFQGTLFTVITFEPRAKLYVPREASFPIPLKCIDVTRATSYVTGCDAGENYRRLLERCQIRGQVLQGSRYWMKNHRMDFHGLGGRLTRKQTTSKPDSLWPEIWKDMSEASKRREKQKWAIEKPKLDSAGKLRGIYFCDPADEEFKDIIKNAHRKMEVPMPAAMPCRTGREEYRETCGILDNRKTKYACIVEADESAIRCMDGPLHKGHEDHIAGRGINSLNHYNLVHKFIPMPQAIKIPDAKAAVDKKWEKLGKIPTWQLTKVINKKEVFAEVRKEGKTVHFASLVDI